MTIYDADDYDGRRAQEIALEKRYGVGFHNYPPASKAFITIDAHAPTAEALVRHVHEVCNRLLRCETLEAMFSIMSSSSGEGHTIRMKTPKDERIPCRDYARR